MQGAIQLSDFETLRIVVTARLRGRFVIDDCGRRRRFTACEPGLARVIREACESRSKIDRMDANARIGRCASYVTVVDSIQIRLGLASAESTATTFEPDSGSPITNA
jgi:hypothetical protein